MNCHSFIVFHTFRLIFVLCFIRKNWSWFPIKKKPGVSSMSLHLLKLLCKDFPIHFDFFLLNSFAFENSFFLVWTNFHTLFIAVLRHIFINYYPSFIVFCKSFLPFFDVVTSGSPPNFSSLLLTLHNSFRYSIYFTIKKIRKNQSRIFLLF